MKGLFSLAARRALENQQRQKKLEAREEIERLLSPFIQEYASIPPATKTESPDIQAFRDRRKRVDQLRDRMVETIDSSSIVDIYLIALGLESIEGKGFMLRGTFPLTYRLAIIESEKRGLGRNWLRDIAEENGTFSASKSWESFL